MAGKGKYGSTQTLLKYLLEEGGESAGKTYKKTGTNTVSQQPQPVPTKPPDPPPAPSYGDDGFAEAERLRKVNPNAKSTYDALKTDAERLAYLKDKRGDTGRYKASDGNLTVYELEEYNRLTKAAKEAELAEAGVEAARKKSGGSVKSGATRSYTEASKPRSRNPSYTEATSKAVEAAKKEVNKSAQSSTKKQVSNNQEKFRRNKTGKQFQQISADEKARAKINAEGDAARADTVNRKTEAAIKIILDYAKKTQAGGRITREAILANNRPERIIEQADNLVKRFGGQPNTFTADKFKALVEEVGVKDALESVQAGLNNGSIAKDKGLQAAMAEARGDVVVQNNLPKSKRRKTPEQLEQQRKAEAAAAEKKAAADKAREAAEAEVARQNQLQAQRDKPSLPVRAFNNTAEYLKRNYDNGNVRRAVQTGTVLGTGLTGLAWLANALMSESDEERKAREQAELDMYR